MEYKIVTVMWPGSEEKDFTQATRCLEEEVTKMIAKGWELQGGVAVTYWPEYVLNSCNCTLSQAMIRKEPAKPPTPFNLR
jgi:hypothetical protein